MAREYFRSAGPEARVEQAFDLSSKGRDEEAIALLYEAIESHPENAIAYHNRALSKVQLGHYE